MARCHYHLAAGFRQGTVEAFPSPSMTPFLTVKEAALLTGKSPSSIRRIIYPILENDQHADRKFIEPSVADVSQLRIKGENFAWRVSEELLRREVPADDTTVKGTATMPHKASGSADAELLSMLRRELDIKNQQITQQAEMLGKQMQLVESLSERLREGNILIGSLQQQLALPEGRKSISVEPVRSKPAAPHKSEKGSGSTAKSKQAKPGYFSRLFRFHS